MVQPGKKIVLIVEDEDPLRTALVHKLEREGFDTITAKNGKQGLNLATKKQPDLIILDIIMPKMDGMTMLKELRKTKYGKEAPVIILTNLEPSGEELVKDISETEPTYFLIKTDYNITDIVEKIHTVIG